MKKWLKALIIIFIILIVIAVLGYAALYRYKEKLTLIGRKADEKLDIATPVAVYTARTGTISESLVLNGEVFPKTEVNIYSTVAGKVKDISVSEGGEVKKGKVLARIDRSEAGITYAPTPVESTIDGIVKKTFIEIGDYITPQSPLFQIIDIEEIEVVVYIPEKDISRVRPGLYTEITVISYPKSVFTGMVSKVSPVVDPVSRTLEARICIDNNSQTLKPGMFGEVRIIMRKSKDSLIIPLSAVIERNGKDVIIIEEDGKAVQVEPVLDIREGDRISVLKGLSAGQKVVVIGQHNVSTGDKVSITEEVE